MKELATVILAAGKGKRMMNPSQPKVMSLLDGIPLIKHVLNQVDQIPSGRTIVIAGYKKEILTEYLAGQNDNIQIALQEEQLGTGHAVQQAAQALDGFDGDVLILCGDVPLLSATTLNRFIEKHQGCDLSVLSAIVDEPFGYGRIVRDDSGNFICIVEEKDSNDEQKKINEINSGVFLVDGPKLFSALSQVSNSNAQGEYYLTDIVDILVGQKAVAQAVPGANPEELKGVNSPDDLKKAEAYYLKNIKKH